MPCEVLKLCDYWTWHREGESCVTVGAQFWEGNLHMAICLQDKDGHHPHLDIKGAKHPLFLSEKISMLVRRACF